MSDSTVEIHSNPYLAEFHERRESGQAIAIDRAMAALERADQARSILSEADECDTAQVLAEFARVRQLAQFAGECHRRIEAGDDSVSGLAEQAATEAEQVAVRIQEFDSARFEGLKQPVALGDTGQVKLQ